ncbi:hypothetical protein BDR07DRAFT_1487588 [Suillus spraguei]|nr:hypothetical protein BDR07DRAFT_1487588 [Suillus spraguei]
MLDSVSVYALALPIVSLEREVARDIGRYRAFIEGTQPVLGALSTMKFADVKSLKSDSNLFGVEPGDGVVNMQASQIMHKRDYQNTRVTIDASLFVKLGMAVPPTSEAATSLSAYILSELKKILSFYLSLLRRTELVGDIKALLFPNAEESANDVAPEVSFPEDVESSTEQSAYPMVQPMKAALYFDNANGFGEWRILISTEAYKHLREHRRADKKIFKIIYKKIKHLSHGQFSADNHKRLNGPDAGISCLSSQDDQRPTTGGNYQIDCVPDQDGESERQEPEPEIPASPLDLNPKDMEDLHSLLALEKYVTFSQAFLHSLIANQDVHHVFMLSTKSCSLHYVMLCFGSQWYRKTTTMLFKILGMQRAWELRGLDMPKPRQIFVTKSRMLAKKVEEYFTRLLESMAMAGYTLPEIAKLKAQSIEDDLIDIDDAPEVNLPARYSQLGDKHFPLFVTFDQLAKMIAADIFNMDDPGRDVALNYIRKAILAAFSAGSHQEPYEFMSKFISKQFLNHLTGIIKGSEQALGFHGSLDRSSYICLSSRSNPVFANQRDTLYDIFEIYRKFKKQKHHFDVADRTHAILKVLRNQNFPGQQVDYLYVDEAQDNLLIDALGESSFPSSIRENSNGLFWAGDTAQTISAGSSFRFNDLKAFIYRMELNKLELLRINQRCFNWPPTTDRTMASGTVDGVKPVFFTDVDNDSHCKRFLVGESASNLELGARQCILVRDEAAVKKLQEQVGDIGMTMTLYDSKGSLYNFFGDSAIDASRWRVVLNGVEGQKYAPDFYRDEARYAGICSELKLLYVGITRARRNVWIFDTSDKSDAMRIFWKSQNLISTCARGTDVPPLAVSSTPEEWASSGRSLFFHKRYTQALHCFKHADLRREVKGFYYGSDAFVDCAAAATGNERRQYYRTSADSYVRGGQYIKAADTYLKAEEAPVPLFSSFEEELEFLEEYDLNDARVSLLVSHSMYYEVAEIHLSENRPMEAIQAFLKDNRNIDSAARAADTLLEFMWREFSFRITPKATVDNSVRQAIALADELQVKKLEPMSRNLILMFQSIWREDHESLKKLARTFQEHGHYTAALHCLDHFFARSTDIRPFQLHEMASFLECFIRRRECDVQTLLSVVPLSGDKFLIPSGTFLYNNVTKTPWNRLVSVHQSGYTASRKNMTELIRRSIRTVLKDKVLAVDEMCCHAPVFSQCLSFIVFGTCQRDQCPQNHVTRSSLGHVHYNAHVAIHMQLILILQLMYSAHPSMKQWESVRDRLEHLHEVLAPPSFIQGSLADLDLTLIPHGLAGLRVVKNWICESFYLLNPSNSPQFLTTLMRIASLSFTFDRNDAPAYITQAKCLTQYRYIKLLRKPDNRYLVMDMINSYQGAAPSSISSGILFLLHVLHYRLRVNLSVLCDCIEDILSSFVINHRMDRASNELPLHGVVLPSNWLIFPNKFSVKKYVEPGSISSLLDAVGNLIQRLRMDGATDSLWLTHVGNITPLLRNIFIFRLTLCLVAHNTRYPMVKRKVNSIVLDLHKTYEPQRPAYYRKLVDNVVEYMALLPNAGMPRLNGYLRAVLNFNTNDTASDLVKLVHKTKQSTQVPSSVRQLLYQKASEIPYLLSSHMVAAQSSLRVEAATFVPRMQHAKGDVEICQAKKENLEPIPQEADVEEVEEEEVPVVIDSDATDGMEDIDEAVTSLASLDPVPNESLYSNGPSEEQEWAAHKIQDAYRYHVWRCSSSAGDGEIDAIFKKCLKQMRSSGWRPSHYRLLFLGPLPHLLACLEQGITLTHAAKMKTKYLNQVPHEQLEELGRQRNKMTSLLKKGLQLRSKLEPSSLDHRTRDIDALKHAVLEVGEFIQEVPGSTKDMQKKFQMAYKGIVAEKKLFCVKPALNTEDL